VSRLAQATEQRGDLADRPRLLKQLTKNVLETAPEAELTEFPGYDKSAIRGSFPKADTLRRRRLVQRPVEVSPASTPWHWTAAEALRPATVRPSSASAPPRAVENLLMGAKDLPAIGDDGVWPACWSDEGSRSQFSGG
jgi:hypothetical protein